MQCPREASSQEGIWTSEGDTLAFRKDGGAAGSKPQDRERAAPGVGHGGQRPGPRRSLAHLPTLQRALARARWQEQGTESSALTLPRTVGMRVGCARALGRAGTVSRCGAPTCAGLGSKGEESRERRGCRPGGAGKGGVKKCLPHLPETQPSCAPPQMFMANFKGVWGRLGLV